MDNRKGLVKRFSRRESEMAAQISNDIAEDIDNGHTPAQLRMAVAFYSDLLAVESQKRAEFESKVRLFRSAKKLMDSVLGKGVSVNPADGWQEFDGKEHDGLWLVRLKSGTKLLGRFYCGEFVQDGFHYNVTPGLIPKITHCRREE